MNNFREVNDDILKEWLEFREETAFCDMSPQDKKYCIYFEEIVEKILKYIPNMFKNNLISLIKILWIIYTTGMRNTIEMVLLMECS